MSWRRVESTAIRQAARRLEAIVVSVSETTQLLKRDHEDLRERWNDPACEEFSRAIGALQESLRAPCHGLTETVMRLDALAKSIESYVNAGSGQRSSQHQEQIAVSTEQPAIPHTLEPVGETLEIADLLRWIGPEDVARIVTSLASVVDASGRSVGASVATAWATEIAQIIFDDQENAINAAGQPIPPSETISDIRSFFDLLQSVAHVPNIAALIDTYIANGGPLSDAARQGTYFQLRVLKMFATRPGTLIESVEFPRYTPQTGRTGDVDIVTIENGYRVANELKAHDWTLSSVARGAWIGDDLAQIQKNLDAHEPGISDHMFHRVRLVLPAGAPVSLQQLLAKKMEKLRVESPSVAVEYAFFDPATERLHTY